jgi:hypothetical protein
MGGSGSTSPSVTAPEPLTEVEVDAISEYQLMAYAIVNDILRSGGENVPGLRQGQIDQANIISEELSDAARPTTQDQTLYRALGMDGEKDFIDAGKGGIALDKGFVSTTQDIKVAYERSPMDYVPNSNKGKSMTELLNQPGMTIDKATAQFVQEPRFWIATIHVPAGSPAIDVNKAKTGNDALSYEKEIILDKGERFRVDGVDYEHKNLTLTRLP